MVLKMKNSLEIRILILSIFHHFDVKWGREKMPRANTKSDFDSESVRMHTEACSILIFDFKPAFCPILANILKCSLKMFVYRRT